KLMEFRNYYPAFDGDYTIHDSESEGILEISWQHGETEAHLSADFSNNSFEIRYFDQEAKRMETLNI
ncbi:MAG: sucrose phosphorylase, partial [Halanaerobiales bacterium]|nr:sucrose phosphorylase [Halanaerobiales bacterium]